MKINYNPNIYTLTATGGLFDFISKSLIENDPFIVLSTIGKHFKTKDIIKKDGDVTR